MSGRSDEDVDEEAEAEDDEQQHSRAAAAAAGAASAKRKSDRDAGAADSAAAADDAGGASPLPRRQVGKAGKWTTVEDLSLCSSLLSYLKEHKGSLPQAIKGAADKGWKDVALLVPKVASMDDKLAAARSCANRWNKLRSEVKDKLDGVIATFRTQLIARHRHNVMQSLDLEEDAPMDAATKKTVDAAVKKKMSEVMNHVRVVKTASYGYLQWDMEYRRTPDEAVAWQETQKQHENLLKLEEAISAVYSALGLAQTDEEAEVVDLADDEQEHKAKKKRLSSSSSSSSGSGSGGGTALAGLREVLHAFAPAASSAAAAAAPAPVSAAIWVKQVGLTDEQRKQLRSITEDDDPSPLILSCLLEQDLAPLALKPYQWRAWQKLSAAVNVQ